MAVVDIKNELTMLMSSYCLNAYQSLLEYPGKISYTKISKVSYLLKLKAQSNSISDLDRKHKAWGKEDNRNNTYFT